jgi:hypothetical protein
MKGRGGRCNAPAVADLARKRAARDGVDRGDGRARLGEQRALIQLARNLATTAENFERSPPELKRCNHQPSPPHFPSQKAGVTRRAEIPRSERSVAAEPR